MLKLAQITDLHIGGDYNGKYKVKENFEKVIKDIPKDIDILVITGDIADSNYEKNYNYVQDVIEQNLKDTDYLAMVGNHDNREILESVFSDNFILSKVFNMHSINGRTMLSFVDTASGTLSDEEIDEIDAPIVFTHYPLAPIHHDFMERYSLIDVERVKQRIEEKGIVKDVFCGHFHNELTSFGKFNVHVTPATQCQIDPMQKEFAVSSYQAGYRLIDLDNNEIVNNIVKYV